MARIISKKKYYKIMANSGISMESQSLFLFEYLDGSRGPYCSIDHFESDIENMWVGRGKKEIYRSICSFLKMEGVEEIIDFSQIHGQ